MVTVVYYGPLGDCSILKPGTYISFENVDIWATEFMCNDPAYCFACRNVMNRHDMIVGQIRTTGNPRWHFPKRVLACSQTCAAKA